MSKAKKPDLRAGKLIESDKDDESVSRFAVIRATNDINKLPTWEVIRRIYVRHNLRIWQTLAIVPWVITIWMHL